MSKPNWNSINFYFQTKQFNRNYFNSNAVSSFTLKPEKKIQFNYKNSWNSYSIEYSLKSNLLIKNNERKSNGNSFTSIFSLHNTSFFIYVFSSFKLHQFHTIFEYVKMDKVTKVGACFFWRMEKVKWWPCMRTRQLEWLLRWVRSGVVLG